MAFEQGPYLQLAAFCEMVLEDKQGVLSLIRVIDRLIQHARGPGAPEDMPPLQYILRGVISLKAGSARGSHEIKIVPEAPSGLNLTPLVATVLLEGEDRGANLVFDMQMAFDSPGLWWFNIHLNDQFLTRMPLRVVYERITLGPQAS